MAGYVHGSAQWITGSFVVYVLLGLRRSFWLPDKPTLAQCGTAGINIFTSLWQQSLTSAYILVHLINGSAVRLS